MSEAERIKRTLSRWTEVALKISEPDLASPAASQQLRWFLTSPYSGGSHGSFHVSDIWETLDGEINIESTAIGNTLSWIEVEYGNEKLEEASTIDLTNFSDEKVRTEFCNRFPIVGQRLDRYEEFVKDASSEWGSELKIRYAGEPGGFAAAFVRARILASGLNLQSKLSQMKRAIEALDDSLNAICKYDLARLKDVREGRVSD